MSERGATEVGRLVRLGFTEPRAAATSLTDAGLWAEGGPVDEEAAVVVMALGETPEPDLAAHALARLARATPDPSRLARDLRELDGFRRRLLGVLGTSTALGDHLVAHPADVEVLVDDEVTSARPSLLGLQSTLLAAVGADPAATLP
ncbi:MAG: hypothetical protein WCD35_16080, partial [Mycobacteriales bacterium]